MASSERIRKYRKRLNADCVWREEVLRKRRAKSFETLLLLYYYLLNNIIILLLIDSDAGWSTDKHAHISLTHS